MGRRLDVALAVRERGAWDHFGYELVFFYLQAGYSVSIIRLLRNLHDTEQGMSSTTSRDEREPDCACLHGSQEERDA